MDIPGYDAWKLATPPRLEEDDVANCRDCGEDYDCPGGGNDSLCPACEERVAREKTAEGPEWDDPWGGTVER